MLAEDSTCIRRNGPAGSTDHCTGVALAYRETVQPQCNSSATLNSKKIPYYRIGSLKDRELSNCFSLKHI